MEIALQIGWEFHLDPPAIEVEDFHDLGGRLMEELLKLEGCNANVHDSTVSTEFDRGVILVELLVIGGENDDAFTVTETALSVVRTAIHAVEVGTPTWPTADDLVPVEFRYGGMKANSVDVPAFA